MGRREIFYVLIGAALYYGFLKFKLGLGGAPWAPKLAVAAV
jgi:hypothetical protein